MAVKRTSNKKSSAKRSSTKAKASEKKATRKTVPRKSVLIEAGERIAGIGSEAVRQATGRGWQEWLAILDEAGARAMDHPTIARLLNEAYKVPGWWAQMVTVGYEQARGMREKHETSRGFEAGRSKTIAASPEDVFAAWKDGRRRARWLADPDVTIRTAMPGKSLRITWIDGKSSVDVGLFPRGESKTQVQVQHARLANAREVERKKAYWGDQLERLKELLEK
jgi:uncharacterized protein YndB with AHSA1/START domain